MKVAAGCKFFSIAPPSGKKYFYTSMVNANHSATPCYLQIFGQNSLPYYWPGHKASGALARKSCVFYASIFDH
jgi:hypothetical protein